MAVNNLFAAEPAILARLRAQTTGLKTIASASLLAGEASLTRLVSAALVIPGAGAVTKSDPRDRTRIETQDWDIVICVEHIKSASDSATTAAAAGEFARQIIAALNTWKPAANYKPLTYQGHGEPLYHSGYAEFPLFFTTDCILSN